LQWIELFAVLRCWSNRKPTKYCIDFEFKEKSSEELFDEMFQELKKLYLCSQFHELRTMKKGIITEEQQKTARYAKAMGHPIRMYVLDLLSKQSCCYSSDLTEDLPIVKSTLSQHLKELKDAGLIQGEIEAPRIKYCLNRENWKEAQDLFRKFLKLEIEEPTQKCQ